MAFWLGWLLVWGQLLSSEGMPGDCMGRVGVELFGEGSIVDVEGGHVRVSE